MTGKYKVGDWLVDSSACEMSHGNARIKLTPRAMVVLEHLALHPGDVVTLDDCLHAHWPRSVTSPNAVHKVVAELRHALAEDSHYIETVPKRGYRLRAPVEKVGPLESRSESDGANGSARRNTHGEAVSERTLVSNGSSRHPVNRILRSHWGWIAGCVVLASAIGLSRLAWPPAANESTNVSKSLAVLRFRNIDANPANAFLADGIARALQTNLSRAPELKVVSADLAQQRSLDNETVRSIGESLDARYLLDGSVQRIADRIRITASLYESPSGDVLYAYNRDQPVAKILDAQNQVIAALLSELKVSLDEKQSDEMRNWGTRNVGAYLAAAEGMHFGSSRAGFDFRSLEYAASKFREAIQLDPGFLYAYNGLAGVLGDYGTFTSAGTKRRSDIRAELALMRETVAKLDPTSNALKSIQFAETRLEAEGNLWMQLEAQARSQIQAAGSPNKVDANYALYSDYLVSAHLFKEAEAFLDVYERFNPTPHPGMKFRRAGITALMLGPARGLPAIEEVSRMVPNYVWPMVTLSGQHSLLGQYAAAERVIMRMRDLDPNEGKDYSFTAWIIMSVLSGNLKDGTKQLNDATSAAGVVEFPRGFGYLIAGDIDSGLAVWRKIRPEHRESMYRSTVGAEQYMPAWVTADPRYQEYLEEIGIGATWTRFMYEKVAELAPITGVRASGEVPQAVFHTK